MFVELIELERPVDFVAPTGPGPSPGPGIDDGCDEIEETEATGRVCGDDEEKEDEIEEDNGTLICVEESMEDAGL